MNTNRTEQWKTIQGYERYQVSNRGRVRSINFNHTGETKLLSISKNQHTGYMQVALYDIGNKRQKNVAVHRLVAMAFIPNPHGFEQVDHKDGDRTHNTVSNLRWTTRKRNNSRKLARKRKSMNCKNTQHREQLVKATKNGEERLFKNVMQCCRELGFSHVLGYRVINQSDYAKKAKGWKLEFVPLTYGII